MIIRGAIFDLDGTLIDSMFKWESLGNDYLASKGIKAKEDLQYRLETMTLEQAAEYFISDYDIKLSVQQIMDAINKMIEDFYINDVLVKPGVVGFLEDLRRNDVKMCIATANSRELTTFALKKNCIYDFFEEIFTCEEIGIGKHSPKIYDKALLKLSTDKEKTYVFEDSLFAIKTAKENGYKVVGVYDKSANNYVEEIMNLSDIFVNSFDEMRFKYD